jgi:hypothetical protein
LGISNTSISSLVVSTKPGQLQFEGSFVGGMRYVLELAGRAGETFCREVACAAAGHPECRFELRWDPVA